MSSTLQALLANNIEVESPEDRERLEEIYAIGKEIPSAPDDLPEPNFSENVLVYWPDALRLP